VPALFAVLSAGAAAQSARDLADLSIEELSNIEVTSVSRRPESLAQSAASIYVITAEDIRRSGATSLPEALRLAPNLEVGRFSSSGYTISARGFNSINAANKMLVLIDGRSVFTPFFNSAFWDQQDVMLADVDRIEVISGPGGTLWGANAVNGVINVITKSSAGTQGGLVDAVAGGFEQRGAVRYGGRIGEHGTFRAYAQAFGEDHTFLADGSDAQDGWRGSQAGFRSDFDTTAGAFTLQGDAYENRVDSPGGRRSGGNVLGRWSRRLSSQSSLEVQAFYDEQNRSDVGGPDTPGISTEEVRTFDVQVEQTWVSGQHEAVWGFGHRAWRDRFVNTINPFVLDPESQSVSLTNVYAQDTYAVTGDLKLTAGVKFEYSSFSGWAVMPSFRAGWQAAPRQFFWAAVSRAVRPPSRLERDLTFPGLFDTSPEFESEKLVAYEAGWRSQLAARASASVSLFYNDYTDLRTTALGAGFFPGTFRNGLEGHTYGLEAWGSFAPYPWWRLDPGVTLLHKDFHLKPGEIDAAGPQTVLGHDPANQWFLRSYMDLPRNLQLYVALRRIAALGDIGVPGYFAADVRLAWQVTPNLELSVRGDNVTDARHAEASVPPIQEIPRTAYFGVRWTFK
jgi:iron complex outermembrane receptor protein